MSNDAAMALLLVLITAGAVVLAAAFGGSPTPDEREMERRERLNRALGGDSDG